MDCAADTFPAFVENVVSKYPAWCSSMFEDYVGPPDRPIDFIGRYESLADDAVRALHLAGERFDESVLRATPPVNVSHPYEAVWTPALVDAVARSEARRCDGSATNPRQHCRAPGHETRRSSSFPSGVGPA